MTGSQIIDFFEDLVDDSLDSDFALQLMNNAKEKVEGYRDWQFLKKLDSSNSASSSPISLPSDWRKTLAIYVNRHMYHQIPFEQSKLFDLGSYRWYLDLANSQINLIGSSLTGTVNHFYIYQTDDIATGTSPVWPDRFHKLLGFETAKLFYAVDQGDRVRAWDDKWDKEHEMLLGRMVDWDADLEKRAVENMAYQDQEPEFDLGQLG